MARAPAQRTPGRRLVLCLDGTYNSVETNTNVWRFYALCADQCDRGIPQLRYYDEGVGNKLGEKFLGGALGFGVSRNVIAAYRWLIANYTKGDDIFIIGFSRGAYAARSLAGLIAQCGLLQPGAPVSVEEVYKRYRDAGATDRTIVDLYVARRLGETSFTRSEAWLLKYSRRVYIHFIGVFDTVGSLGLPFGDIPYVSRNRLRFHYMRLSSIYRHCYHALAIDEHRADFSPSLWVKTTPYTPLPTPRRKRPQSIVEQRWFVGAHANVGGGYRDDRLAQLPLAWMVDKASEQGLAFRYPVNIDEGSHLDAIRDSYAEFLCGAYRGMTLGRRHYRTIVLPPRDTPDGVAKTVNETIDGSVFDRWQADGHYRPTNLKDLAERLFSPPSPRPPGWMRRFVRWIQRRQ